MNFAIDPPNIGAISATVTAGQTATYQLALQSIDGFAGPVTLTCTGAPAGATCTVIPTPVTLAANATAPFQVQVTTTARTGSANLVRPPKSPGLQTSHGLQTPQDPQTPPGPPPASPHTQAFLQPASSSHLPSAPVAPSRSLSIWTQSLVIFSVATHNLNPVSTISIAAFPLITTFPILLAVLCLPIAITAALFIISTQPIAWPQALASHQIRTRPQARQHNPTAHRPPTSKPNFSKYAGSRIAIAAHVSPQIAIAATLEIALLLSTLSCNSKTPPLPQSGTPANTYTLTLSASTPGGPPPTTQPLTLTIQ